MKTARRWISLAALLLGLLVPPPAAAQGHAYPAKPGEVILKMKKGASAQEHQAILTDLGATNVTALPSIGAEKMRITKRGVDEAIARYRKHPKVQFIEPNYIYKAVATTPNDPEFSRLWGLLNTGQTGGLPGADIDATFAWDVFTGTNDVLIAVTDTGIDWTHPDLAANVFTNPGEIPGNGIDDDHNGFIDDVRGWDFVNHDNNPMDDHFHGTHVSGTIGAIGNNGIGVVGVNWHVKILPCKFLDAFGSGSTDDAVAAINYAAMMHARVINASWGGGGPSEALRLAIQAAGDSGTVFVAAAGNSGQDTDINPNYPSAYDLPNIVAVAATDASDRLAGFSNYGRTSVDLAAPGVDVYSTMPGGYGYLSGTSMATPHVAGALGLIFGRFPGIGPLDAKALLLNGVDPIPSLTGLVLTGGRLNAFTPIMEPDSIAPGAIVDLATLEANGTRVKLLWTATGDDGGSGTARRYEMRYSTAPITAANFASAALASGAPTPRPAGQRDTMQVTGLEFSTPYYFALKAFDEFGNASPISNVVTATTLAPPDIAVTPSEVQADLTNGQTATRVIHVTNTGPAELNLSIALQNATTSTTVPIGPRLIRASLRPAAPLATATATATATNTTAASYPSSSAPYDHGKTPMRAPYGLDSLRVGNILSGSLRLLVLYTGDVSEIRSLLAGFPDIALVDVYNAQFGTPTLDQLLAYDAVLVAANFAFADRTAAGNVLADYADAGGGVVLTLASFISGWNLQGRFLTDGYSPFPPGGGPIGGSTLGSFDAAHPIMAGVTTAQGNLLGDVQLSSGSELVASWVNSEPFVATKGHVAAVNIFVASSGYWIGDIPLILHNAAFWSAGGSNWLTIDHDAAVIPSGGALDVVATFNASDLDGGDYERWINFSSDDPDESSIIVPARLHVTGTPDIAVEGEPVTVESAVDYLVDGARTSHHLVLPSTPAAGAGGTLELIADGDYGDPVEHATAIAEGTVIGDVGSTGIDCSAATGSFPLSAAQLATLASDGSIDVDVQNTIDVNVFCPVNRHTVRVKYGTPPDQLAFGTLFVGASRNLSLIVRNRGSAPLSVSSITSDRAEFVPGSTSLSIAPRQSQTLVITFHPGSAATFTGTLRLESNDPDTPEILVALSGTGVNPPVAGVDPTSLSSTLVEGNEETQNLRLLNTGESPLEFTVQILPAATAFQVVPFAGLSSTAPSNNPAPAPGAGAHTATSGEPKFEAESVRLGQLQSSPVPLTCVVGDPPAGFVYAQANQGTAFYRYRASSNTWERLADAPLNSLNNGGATLLNGHVYTSYTNNPSEMGVYDIASNSWSRILRPLGGGGTGNIASDGTQFLYLVDGGRLWRYEPATTTWVERIGPPFYFQPWGGLQYLDGRLYGHEGNGLQGFATYDVASNSWTQLQSVPAGAVLGAAMHPALRKYYAYGSYFGTNLYQYSLDSGTWSVSTNPFFSINDGGMAWLSGANDGIYFVQGENGTGFARIIEAPEFVSVSPDSGVVPPHGALDLGAHFTTGDLIGGTYHAAIGISSNDPVRPLLSVPATLTVIGVPRIALEPEPITVSSSVDYSTNGALTRHRLTLPVPLTPGLGGGSLEFIADGDYYYPWQYATLTVEGLVFGPFGGTFVPCGRVDQTIPLNDTTLAGLAADGFIDAQVQNSPDVSPFCGINRHTVVLRYPGPPGEMAFGSLFIGASRSLQVVVKNRGSAPLVISSITCDRPEFTTSAPSATIPARSSMVLIVTFHPTAAQTYAATLRLASNDPDHPETLMPLSGTGLVPPDIAVSPSSIDASLFTGETASRTLTIRNEGGSDLIFDASVEDPPVVVTQYPAAMTTKGQPDLRPGIPTVANHGGPDAFGHRWIDNYELGGPQFSWVEISATGTPVPAGGDDWNYGPIPIGFQFPYYNGSFSSFHVSSNGFISFTSASAQFSNQPLPSLSAPENLLSVFWSDLQAPFGSVFYQYDGFRLIVEWKNVSYLGSPNIPFTFEALLYPNGHIIYQYLDMHGTQTFATVGMQNATRDDGLTMAFNRPYAVNGLAISIAALPPYLAVTPTSGVVPAGGHLDLEARFDATGMLGGDYMKNVVVRSNDPDESPLLVPAHLHVTGAPDIAVAPSALDYGSLFIGLAKAETLVVGNVGTDVLEVSGISSSRPEYEVVGAGFNLAPGTTHSVIVTFRPTTAGPLPGTLNVQSNDPDEPVLHVALNGIGQVPPDIAVTPASLEASLFTGQETTRMLTVQNTGGSDLVFHVIVTNPAAPATAQKIGGPIGSAASAPRGAVATRADPGVPGAPSAAVAGTAVTPPGPSDQRPQGYVTGAAPPAAMAGGRVLLIQDAHPWGTSSNETILGLNGITFDIIPSGVLPTTDLSSYERVIVPSDQTPSTYSVLQAQAAQIDQYVNDGGVLEFHAAAWGWNGGDDSQVILPGGMRIYQHFAGMNDVLEPGHPIMAGVPDPFTGTSASHASFSNIPSDALLLVADDVGVPNLVGYQHGRGYVIAGGQTFEYGYAYAQSSGIILAHMIAFDFKPWLSVTPSTGTVPAGGQVQIAVRFDATGLPGGDYDKRVLITSNDPDESEVGVPAHLHVTGAPDIALSRDALDFGTFFVGLARSESLTVKNTGTELLTVTGITSSRAEYELDPGSASFTLTPRASRVVMVTFRPTVPGTVDAVLTVQSNDPDEGELHVALTGTGLIPPDIALAPLAVTEDLLVGQTSVRAVTVANDGGSPLDVSVGLRLPAMAASVASVASLRTAPRPPASVATPLRDAEKALHLESYKTAASSQSAPAPTPRISGIAWRSQLPARTRSLFPASSRSAGRAAGALASAGVAGVPPGAFILFADDMESGEDGWTHYATSDSIDQWAHETTRSSSGVWSWNVSQHAYQGSDALQTPPIDLSVALDATLTFQHWYQFDDCFDPSFEPDGGIVEIALDDTSSWQQIYPTTGYPYVLDDICGNPLAYYQAYSHSSGGFQPATFDLTPFVGHTIRLRFRAGWDCGNCNFNEGWYIDDVAVYSRGPTWVTVAPTHLIVDPHTHSTVNLSFNATGLDVGIHEAQLVVASNDPDEPTLMVPVSLQVADVSAVVNVDPDAVNLGRRGNWVTAYLELPPPFDLNQVVIETLRLNRAATADPDHHSIGDVDHNRIPDMTIKFVQDELAPTLEEGDQVPVIVSGEIAGNHRFMAQGLVRVIRHKITTPNGGETVTPGSVYSVGWNVPSGWQPDHADVYLSVNGGVTWSLIGTDVHGPSYAWTVPDWGSNQALVRVNLYDGIGLMTHDTSDQPFTIIAPSTSVATSEVGGPRRLLQNAPNPFHAGIGTTIAFELPSAAPVRLAVYDAAGHLVRTVAEEWMTPGRHQAIWDGRDRRGNVVASGVYFYQLWDGRERLTRRMVMIR